MHITDNGKIMNNSTEQYNAVAEFMKLGSQDVNTEFTFQSLGVANFRIRLIDEEINGKNEMIDCAGRDDTVGVLDGICDALYVTLGAAATFGVDVTNIQWNSLNPNSTVTVLPAHQTLMWHSRVEDAFAQFTRGVNTGDQITIRAGLKNLICNLFDYATACNFDLPGAFAEVHASNMSKFCPTYQHAEESIAEHRARGDDKYNDVYIAPVGDKFAIKRSADNKILKGKDFFEPNLAKFVKA